MTILDDILATKRDEVAGRRAALPLGELEARAAGRTPPRGFAAALTAKAATGRALIAEIKKASPSKGLIRPDFDPAAHAAAYADGGAACLSVLTDADYFQGHEDYLVAARAACGLPVIRKDFMIDPWQALESRSIGADAILLIMAALGDHQAAEIEEVALGLGMDVLVEVHDATEFERALRLRSRLIGVNNRNLKDFTVDVARTYEIAALAGDEVMLVAESGLSERRDLDEMAARGIHRFLIGESLMRKADVAAATRALVA